MKKWRYMLYLYSIIMGNKWNILTNNAGKESEESLGMQYNVLQRHGSIKIFQTTTSPSLIIWADRDQGNSEGKAKGFLVSLCNLGHFTVKERVCSFHIVTFGERPTPLWFVKGIPHIIMITVYALPKGNVATACDIIHLFIAKLQTQYSSSFIRTSSDFTHMILSLTLTNLIQFVDCPTRDNKTLVLLSANSKDTYSSTRILNTLVSILNNTFIPYNNGLVKPKSAVSSFL